MNFWEALTIYLPLNQELKIFDTPITHSRSVFRPVDEVARERAEMPTFL